MNTFALGDIHGNYHALISVLKTSNFSYTSDHLIVLGDICDGHPYVNQVIDELLKITNLTLIQGNHDSPWALNWMRIGIELPIWYHQGGIHTVASYDNYHGNVPLSHILFLASASPYYLLPNPIAPSSDPIIFVHGGFDPSIPINENSIDTLIWDRQLINYASLHPIPNYSHVYVGHTSTQSFTGNATASTPLTLNNLTMMDTGAGWDGPLSMINIKTGEVFQSLEG